MEEIAINICDICNLKDLSGLTLFNKNLHIAACQKKADKLNNKSVDSAPKSSHRSILSYYSSSSSAKSSQSGKSYSESETSIEEDKTSADVIPITVTSVDSSTLTPCQSKKRKIDFFEDILVTEKYCRGYRLPIDLPIFDFVVRMVVKLHSKRFQRVQKEIKYSRYGRIVSTIIFSTSNRTMKK
jgi:hypothetical protein